MGPTQSICTFLSHVSFVFQNVNEQLVQVKAQLERELEHVSSLEAKVSELEVCTSFKSWLHDGGGTFSQISWQ